MAGILILLPGSPIERLSAQSAGDLGAWDGLMLSPVGALAPLARDSGEPGSRQSNLWFRHGRWRYNVDDAIHSDFGVTLFRRRGGSRTELELTGAYLALSCPNCSAWLSGGVGVETTIGRRGSINYPWRTLAVRADIGGARYLGEGHTTAASAALAWVFTAGRPFVAHSHLSFEFSEGFGIGRIAFVDGIDGGWRPILGTALAWTFDSGFGVNLGLQRVVLADAPPQVGVAMSWR